MPLIADRAHTLEIYARCARQQRVLPAFNSENLTCTEAILAAAQEHAASLGETRLPIVVGLTNLYAHRPQAALYTQTNDARIGLRLFLQDVQVLTGPDTPFPDVDVMVHLDHVQWDADRELLETELPSVASLMFDASTLPLDENIRRTAAFVARRRDDFVIEGACDEIAEAGAGGSTPLTTPEMAARFLAETGVDIVVANLGTEHRAGAAERRYRGDLARAIRERIGPRICLHGTSSVAPDNLGRLFADGVCKVNIWTALERDSAPAVLRDLVRHAAHVVGPEQARRLQAERLLGDAADAQGGLSLDFFPTRHRQEIAFAEMKAVVGRFLKLWYTRAP